MGEEKKAKLKKQKDEENRRLEDEKKKVEERKRKASKGNLDEDLIDQENPMRLYIKRDLLAERSDFTVLRENRGDFLQIDNATGRKRICYADGGDPIPVLMTDVRNSEVN